MVGPFKPAGRLNGMVVRHGYLVREFGETWYADEIASATKSFLSALAGIAFDRGLIRYLHGSVFADTGLALLGGPHNSRITWHHLLQQTSEWDGELFGKVPTGHAGRRIGEPLNEPGGYFEYNDVRVNLLARCLLELFRRPLPEILREAIMDPIGASPSWEWHGYSTSWVEIDGRRIQSVSGGSHWGGGIWMNSRDLARFGLLYLWNGSWTGRCVLSPQWIRLSRTPSALNHMYGYMWWLQHDATGRPVSFAAQGGGSHACFVVPDHDLVIVVKWLKDEAWRPFLDQVLRLVQDRPPLGPVHLDWQRVNAGERRAS